LDSKEFAGVMRAFALLVQLGLSIAVPLVALVWLGQYLGGLFGAEILFLIISIFLGLGAGFTLVYRLLSREIK